MAKGTNGKSQGGARQLGQWLLSGCFYLPAFKIFALSLLYVCMGVRVGDAHSLLCLGRSERESLLSLQLYTSSREGTLGLSGGPECFTL